MGDYPIFCMFLLDAPCIMLKCMGVLRRLGEFPLFSLLFLWETILFFIYLFVFFIFCVRFLLRVFCIMLERMSTFLVVSFLFL